MGVVTRLRPDPLVMGFYTVDEAARLLQIPSKQRIYGWLKGHPRSRAEPIIQRQHQPIGSVQEVGFLDLLEIRFVEHFRRQNISLQSLRRAIKNARTAMKMDHPFATSNIKYLTDRKEVFLETAKEAGDKFLLNLMTNQIEIYEVLEEFLAKGIAFDLNSGIAERWHPRPGEFPNVIVDPRIAFGRPVITPGNVPTETLFSLWKAEDGNFDVVADWHEVRTQLVREAVEFELRMAA
jgi:uncharacterized protein (DUF433 family)